MLPTPGCSPHTLRGQLDLRPTARKAGPVKTMQLGPLVHSDDVISATFSLGTPKRVVLKAAETSWFNRGLCISFHLVGYPTWTFMFMERKGADSMLRHQEGPLRDSINLWALIYKL